MANYKNSMILPKTDFPMRANLAQNEPARLEWWDSIDIYARVLEKNADGEPFVLHDGPPYANGPIHIGHAFNKILKDIVLKNHAQRGYFTPYVPGWDCHGQPIEHMVEKTLGKEKMAQTSKPELRELCRDWATKYVNVQREGFKRLGVNADWERPYLTYTPDYEAGNVELFRDMYLDGAIYRGRKPIHWCASCHTALAEAEIEYSDEVSPSIYVKFYFDEVPDALGFLSEGETSAPKAAVVIWTTTPWTLPANQAVSLNPDAAYVVALVGGEALVMAEELADAVAADAGWEDVTYATNAAGERITFPGSALKGATYKLPVAEGTGCIICGTHVTMDAGTGAVHTAPGHGVDDYKVCAANGIEEIKMPVDDDGRFYEGSCLWGGSDAVGSNEDIIAYLDEAGALIARKDITHSYPHCWRCHKPVIFRATTQWFVSMDKTGLRERALDAIANQVRWVPDWAKNRIGAMVAERPDWCISRQRSWGVPIPVFKCKKCGATVATRESFDAVIELFRTHGADAWFTTDPNTYLPQNVVCGECGARDLAPESDILDVWWESGVSHTSVLKHRAGEGLRWPADLYLEGSDQHRGWFQSSLLTSVGAYGAPPYKSVMHCGFTVDAQGRKMSKSLGNGVDPADVMAKYGADVLRLWVSSVDYSQDVSISDEILKRTSETYRRIRNTLRFILGALDDFDYATCAVGSWDDLEPLDKWIYVRTLALVEAVTEDYDEYRFHMVYRDIYDYIVNDLSAVYMDATKDRLYSEAPASARRRAVQTVLADVLEVLVRIVSPILSFTAEEAWQNYPAGMIDESYHPISVQLAGWPCEADFMPAMPAGVREGIEADFEVLLEVRDAVTKALEEARNEGAIKKSQEADVAVVGPAEKVAVCERYDQAVLCEMFIVSSVAFETAAEAEEFSASVSHTSKPKCERCWNYVERDPRERYEDVCERCANVLDEIGFIPDAE